VLDRGVPAVSVTAADLMVHRLFLCLRAALVVAYVDAGQPLTEIARGSL
jgi:hypothetical protein